MNSDYDILNQYTRIKFHFEDDSKSYKKVPHYPSRTTNAFTSRVDLNFLRNKNINEINMFFIWLFYTKKNDSHKSNQESYYNSEEFKNFKYELRYYKKTLENDFEKVYNAKTFENLKRLMFKKKINPLTFYILMNTKYKKNLDEVRSSNIYKELWHSIKRLSYFINLDKEYIRYYLSRF